MSDTQNSHHTSGSISDYFNIDSKKLSTRTADLFTVQDTNHGRDLSLWIVREKLEPGSPLVNEFLNRMKQFDEIKPSISDLVGYAVDNKGTAFAVLKRIDGHPLIEKGLELFERERRFIAAIDQIARVHSSGLFCGDLCGNSFWVTRNGSVKFIGVCGSIETDVSAGIKENESFEKYLAPEQRANDIVDARADIFALGILTYQLFTNTLPRLDSNAYKPPTQINPELPVWLDEVVDKCLQADPLNRYANAQVMLQEIIAKREELLSEEPRTSISDKIEVANLNIHLESQLQSSSKAGSRVLFILKSLLIVSVLCIVGLFASRYFRNYREISQAVEIQKIALSPHKAVAGDQLRELIDSLLDRNASFAEQKTFIDQIAISADPVAHAVLASLARVATSAQLRTYTEQAIVQRARRNGMMFTSNIAGDWITTTPNANRSGYYEAVFQLLGNSVPDDAKSSALREIYAGNSILALRLGAAASLDSEQTDAFQPVLSQLLGDKLVMTDLEKYSSLALILSSKSLLQEFGEEVFLRADKIPDRDLFWLLGLLADRDDHKVRTVADIILDRGLISGSKKYYLQVLRDRLDLPYEVLNSLVSATLGKLQVDQIASFGRWYDGSLESILLHLSAEELKPDVSLEVFDTLSSRTVSNQLVSKLIEWVRRNHWASRLEFVKSIGMLSQASEMSIPEIETSLAGFDRYIVEGDLLTVLLSTENTNLSIAVIQRYGKVIPLPKLLLLLSDSSKEVRKASILALKDINDVGALRIILESYERENDPEIRKAYEDNFWVIKQRIQGKTQL